MTEELTTSSRRVRADDRPVSGKSHAVEEPLGRGATIGRYVVLGLVGRGGMGEVYAAYDPGARSQGRGQAAARAARPRAATPARARARLLREAQAIARLSHPNVVVVYDVGTFRDSVFIAMEFVEGSTVGYWLHAQPRTWREVLTVFLAAGRGLAAAHAGGLVHRDFKPDNVMVTQRRPGARHGLRPRPPGRRTTPTRPRAPATAAAAPPAADPEAAPARGEARVGRDVDPRRDRRR